MSHKTVFLGGTCNGSQWRDILMLALNTSLVSAYNPVVSDWTPECQAEEIRQRETSDYCLYVITPKMTGVYSIAEVVEDSLKRPEQTLFLILEADDAHIFESAQLKSLRQVGKMVRANGARWFEHENDLLDFLNNPATGPSTNQLPEMRVVIDSAVFPSTENTIVSIKTDDKFNGAHNYEVKPMLRYEPGVGAAYGLEGMPVTFVKKNDDGTWQPGLQSEQLLLLLIDRHVKMSAVFPSPQDDHFLSFLNSALNVLAMRVQDRTRRGVMGEHKQ